MLAPDHLHRVSGEHELSSLRKVIAQDWLAVVEPQPKQGEPRSHKRIDRCFDAGYDRKPWGETWLHTETQDTECEAWIRLLELVDKAASDGRTEFEPLRELGRELRSQIVTLPSTIGQLKSVKKLDLYGSHLVRIPPEIGEMTSLEEFEPYTSYGLHWYPYEITRCKKLKRSTVSTALSVRKLELCAAVSPASAADGFSEQPYRAGGTFA